MKALKTALVVLITGVALSFASQAKATDDFIYDLEPPAGNIGAICATGKKVLVTTGGACLNYKGRKFWIMPNGKKIVSLDYKNPFFDEPHYSKWVKCNLLADTDEWMKCLDKLNNTNFHPDNKTITSVAPPSFFGSIGAVGATCADGWRSYSAGSGTCSHHGGVRNWEYYNPVIINFPPIKPIVIEPIPPLFSAWKPYSPCQLFCD